MPPVARRMMVEVEPLVDAIIDALAKGQLRADLPALHRHRLHRARPRARLHAPQHQADDAGRDREGNHGLRG